MAKTKSTDEAVMELLRKVAKKKEEIKALKKRPNWKTSCTFGKDPSSSQGRINIQTVRDPAVLIDLMGFLDMVMSYRQKAVNKLDLSEFYDDTWQNYSFSDWIDDFKTRGEQIRLERRQKELDELDKRVNKLVSPDQRREMELEALQEILGED